jgi:hypothetical protein
MNPMAYALANFRRADDLTDAAVRHNGRLQPFGRIPDGLHRGGVAVEIDPGLSPHREQQ